MRERDLRNKGKKVSGLTCSPAADLDFFTSVEDVFMFARKLLLKKHFSKDTSCHVFSAEEELEAIQTLESLLSEQEVSNEKFPSSV